MSSSEMKKLFRLKKIGPMKKVGSLSQKMLFFQKNSVPGFSFIFLSASINACAFSDAVVTLD